MAAMANAARQQTPPSSPGSSAMSSSPDAPTPGGAGGASEEELFRDAFPKEHGWTTNENGHKKAARVAQKISAALSGPHGRLRLTPERVLAVLRHAHLVPVEHRGAGWVQDDFHNHVAYGGHSLACQLKDERLSEYLSAVGKTQEEVRRRRATFYQGLFKFEKWLFSKCNKTWLKNSGHPKFTRESRWAYIAKKCGFKPYKEELVVDEDGVVVID